MGPWEQVGKPGCSAFFGVQRRAWCVRSVGISGDGRAQGGEAASVACGPPAWANRRELVGEPWLSRTWVAHFGELRPDLTLLDAPLDAT